ncbi:glycoside hydrolase superfamily [Naematelia encephala]|uniref:Glycoside hydrolase superfamily n=1 Tax=Naematelia encephala TaxID=71784 RepID=A0A1Y2BDU2_9TREE|nr:glycoside hydrolase superfamily [Naematelia encephala]
MNVQTIAPVVQKPSDRAWWKDSTVYQIYPASFCDHAANGHGTLKGILSKITYLHTLGVDIVWLSPIYESPQADMGYDISNYQDLHKPYGTLEDWDEILKAAHAKGMKLVMDLVVNHSSDQHPWFKESRSSKANPKRNWYIWHDGKLNEKGERVPPNNWKACFGDVSAWEWDEATQQYYLHLFLKEQPDLNWENPELRHAVYDMMHWWLKKGIDGFRMDVINFISKVPGFPDAPVQNDRLYQDFGAMSINGPRVHEWLQEMNREVLSKFDCFAVGETPGPDAVDVFSPYSNPTNKELQMVFHFHHQSVDRIGGQLGSRQYDPKWKLSGFKEVFNTFQVEMEKQGGWNSNYLENHDQPRTISRFCSDHPEDRAKSAKLISMFQSSLGGTLFMYQGQEIGLCNVPRDWPEEEYIDVESIANLQSEREYRRRKTGEQNPDMSDMLKSLRQTARDNGRTPMQWDSSEYAGFSKAKPWMRVHDDYADGWNVAAQMKDPNSPWSFWQKMLKLRKDFPALVYGKFIPLDEKNEDTYAYIRDDSTISQILLIVLNFARGDGRGATSTFVVPKEVDVSNAKLIISNGQAKQGSAIDGEIQLSPWEGRIYVL